MSVYKDTLEINIYQIVQDVCALCCQENIPAKFKLELDHQKMDTKIILRCIQIPQYQCTKTLRT